MPSPKLLEAAKMAVAYMDDTIQDWGKAGPTAMIVYKELKAAIRFEEEKANHNAGYTGGPISDGGMDLRDRKERNNG